MAQNLLDDRHQENVSVYAPQLPVELRRGLYGKLAWRF